MEMDSGLVTNPSTNISTEDVATNTETLTVEERQQVNVGNQTEYQSPPPPRPTCSLGVQIEVQAQALTSVDPSFSVDLPKGFRSSLDVILGAINSCRETL